MHLAKKQLLVLAALAVIFAVSFAYAADARNLELNYPTLPGNPPLTLSSKTTLPQLLQYFFTFFVVIGGLIAFGSIVYAGFLFMTSGANPGLRAKAMARIRQAMLGLVLLLSTYIILNTINPELVFLREPGRDLVIPKYEPLGSIQSVFDTIDYASLRYGGVVVFEEPDTSGATGKSETIFHDVSNFEESTYMYKTGISAIKVLGKCNVGLVPLKGGTGRVELSIENAETTLVGNLKNNVKELIFQTKGCLGHSLKIFTEQNFNQNPPRSVRGGEILKEGFEHTLLTNIPDLSKTLFMPRGGAQASMDNIIRSIMFSLAPGDRSPEENFLVKLCDQRGYQDCVVFSQSNPSFSLFPQIDKKASSVQFIEATKRRQAGVIVYRDENFGSFHEIFIASDKNLNPSIVNGSGSKKEISSFQIIGNYKVTFYEKPNFDTSGAWISFDNTGQKDTMETSSFRPAGTHTRPENAIFSVPALSALCLGVDAAGACNKTLNDNVSSIKVEMTVQKSLDQNIICSRVNLQENLCEL